MNRRDFLQTLGVAVPTAVATGLMTRSGTDSSARKNKDITERILDTKQMNCSYITYAPFIMKDPNNGRLSGLFYDLTQKIGELADIEMKWGVETTYATLAEDLRHEKADLFAGGLWPEPKQAKAVNYSLPAFYSGLGVYVRGDDHRFDKNMGKLDDPQFRIATIDGEMSQIVQQSDFPKASVLGLPDNSDISLLAESIASHKADATIIEKAVANLYMLKNPGSLRNLTDAKPIRIFENTWACAFSSPRLKNTIDIAVKEMLSSGYVDKIMAQYEQVQGSFYRVRPPV